MAPGTRGREATTTTPSSGLHRRTYQGIIERGQKAITIVTAKKTAALDLSLWELLREVEEDPGGE